MDRVTYTPPTSELPLVGPEEPADAVPDGHQRSPFVELDRQTWARLASEMAQPFDQADVERLRGLGEHLSLREVAEVYLPLSRLLSINVEASAALRSATNAFLGERTGRTPYVIGVAGSVAVGKSTTARVLQEMLRRMGQTFLSSTRVTSCCAFFVSTSRARPRVGRTFCSRFGPLMESQMDSAVA